MNWLCGISSAAPNSIDSLTDFKENNTIQFVVPHLFVLMGKVQIHILTVNSIHVGQLETVVTEHRERIRIENSFKYLVKRPSTKKEDTVVFE